MNRFVRLGLSATAGILLALGANGHGWWLTVLGLALFLGLIRGQDRAVRLLVTVVVASIWFGVHISWMQILGVDAWLLLVTLCVLPWLLIAVVPLPAVGLRSYLMPTALIVLIEWLHDNIPWGGFPWGNLAYSQVDGPIVGLAAWGGQSLVTAAVCLISLAGLGLIGSHKMFSGMAVVGLLVLCSHWAARTPNVHVSEHVNIALVQGGSVTLQSSDEQQQWQVFNNHIEQTDKLIHAVQSRKVLQPKLIVWPENSTDVDPLNDAVAYRRISELVERAKVPLLIGGVTWQSNPYGPRNSGILWQPQSGPQQIYAKTHLVPFGEYIPLRGLLSAHIGRLSQIPNDFIPGTRPGIFRLNERTFGDVICFEIAYENHLTHLVHGGATFITLQTNNATYLGTKQSEQQFAIARFRAIEHRRSVVMASTTGVSGLINDSGEVVSQSKQGESTFLSNRISSIASVTFTDRHSDWVLTLSLAILGLLVLRQIGNKRRVHGISTG